MATTIVNAVELIENAILFLDSRCDGTVTDDDKGFNRVDTNFGKSLANQIKQGAKLSPKQLEFGLKMLRKYAETQLLPNGYELPTPASISSIIASIPVKKQIRKVEIHGGMYVVVFDYDAGVLNTVKSIQPRGRYNPENKTWWFDKDSFADIVSKLKPLGFEFDADVVEQIKLNCLDEETSLLVNEAKIQYGLNYIESIRNKLLITPFKHQIEAVEFLLKQKNSKCLIADSMGLGKTVSALLGAKTLQAYLMNEDDLVEPVKIFVVSPASVKANWFKEAQSCNLKIEVFSWAKLPQPPEYVKYILIVDECHYAQNIKSQRTKNFLTLAQNDNCKGVICLSGTPMKNGRPSNLYPILSAIQHPIATNRKLYEKRYCDAHPTPFSPWDVSGATNLEELNIKISDKLLRRTKEECLDLPPKLFTAIECENNPQAEAEYQISLQQLKENYHERVDAGEISDNAQAIVFLGYFRRLASIYKSNEAIQLAQEILEQGKQVVIMTDFVESAERIADYFYTSALTGQVPTEKMRDGVKVYPRQQMVDDFQSGKTKVFVSTIKAGGVGITLTAANYLIMVDKPWTPGDYQQATDRIYRIGQTQTCNIYDLYAKDIDYIMGGIINEKSENIDKVLKKIKIIPNNINTMSYNEILKKLMK